MENIQPRISNEHLIAGNLKERNEWMWQTLKTCYLTYDNKKITYHQLIVLSLNTTWCVTQIIDRDNWWPLSNKNSKTLNSNAVGDCIFARDGRLLHFLFPLHRTLLHKSFTEWWISLFKLVFDWDIFLSLHSDSFPRISSVLNDFFIARFCELVFVVFGTNLIKSN